MTDEEGLINELASDEATRAKLKVLATFVKSQKDVEILKVHKDLELAQKDIKIVEANKATAIMEARKNLEVVEANKATEVMEARKSLEIVKANMATEVMEARKNLEIAKAEYCGQIKALEAQVLQVSSACTSRGIYEFALKGCHSELGIKGTFNASSVCKALIDYAAKTKSTASPPETATSFQSMRWTNGIIAAADSCKVDLASLYDLFGILSDRIHGHPWSGPSIIVVSKGLSPNFGCLLQSLATIVGLKVDQVASSPYEAVSETALKSGGP